MLKNSNKKAERINFKSRNIHGLLNRNGVQSGHATSQDRENYIFNLFEIFMQFSSCFFSFVENIGSDNETHPIISPRMSFLFTGTSILGDLDMCLNCNCATCV